MSETRKRPKLVPAECVEHFEIRVVRYFTPDGRAWTAVGISTPDEPVAYPDAVEVHGALHVAHELVDGRGEEADGEDA